MLVTLLALLAPGLAPTEPPAPKDSPPLLGLNDYLSELPKSGVTPEMLDRPTKPKANLLSLFGTEDYPLEAANNDEQGTVSVILKVEADGSVGDCIVVQSSGFPSLDSQTCRLLWMRASFEPARDQAGRAVTGAFRQRIRWELPAPEPMPFKPWTQRFTLDFIKDGGVIGCRLEMTGGLKEENEQCGLVLNMWQSALGRLRADAGYERRTLVFDTEFAPGNHVSPSRPPTGTKLFARQIARLTIDANGKPLQCSVIGTEGFKPPTEGCDDLLETRFEKPGISVGAVEATMVRAAYVSE